MEYQRKFIVKVISTEQIYTTTTQHFEGFIKKIYNGAIGYFYTITSIKENAKTWKYKKNCEKKIKTIKAGLDPTKPRFKLYNFEIEEITDKQTLRKIKLKKLNKK